MCPAARPVSAAAAAVTPPTGEPGSRTSGTIVAGRPTQSSTSGDQVRRARSNRFELEPADGSVTKRPVNRYSTQSESMPMWAIERKTSGWWSRIHQKRAGEVIETQSPATP